MCFHHIPLTNNFFSSAEKKPVHCWYLLSHQCFFFGNTKDKCQLNTIRRSKSVQKKCEVQSLQSDQNPQQDEFIFWHKMLNIGLNILIWCNQLYKITLNHLKFSLTTLFCLTLIFEAVHWSPGKLAKILLVWEFKWWNTISIKMRRKRGWPLLRRPPGCISLQYSSPLCVLWVSASVKRLL